MRAAALAAGTLALAATPAHAAYAPRLDASFSPSTPDTAGALTLTVRQAAGETATRSEVVRFPPDFRFNPGFAVTGCTPEQEAATACPEDSRVGTATADTELGAFAGPVYFTRDFRILIFLRGFGGLVQQKVEGMFRVGSDGWVESAIDELPAVRTTLAQVRLEPGRRSLVVTPYDCGTYPVEGRFLSHEGERATSRMAVLVAGCETRPAIRSLSARGRSRRLEVAWRLAEAGSRTVLAVDRLAQTRPWRRWRRVRSLAAGAGTGENRASVNALAPGRYRVTLTTYGSRGGLADVGRATATVRR
jgi:hypothetical protein